MTTELRLPFGEDPPNRAADLDEEARESAVDPTRSIALSASAGTGKTRVLVNRYVNLLRAGVNPANILAMTFTRKAAAEMRQRIIRTLRKAAEEGSIPAAEWRELRDRLGEVAISTIDAFCLSLLREFPLEAGLDPGFDVADETEVPRLVEEALDNALRIGRTVARNDEAVATVLAHKGERIVRQELTALLDRRLTRSRHLRRLLTAGAIDLDVERIARRFLERLRTTLLDAPGGLESFLEDGPVAHPGYLVLRTEILALCRSDDLQGSLALLGEPSRIRPFIDAVHEHFLTEKGEPRKALSRKFRKEDHSSPHARNRHLLVVRHLAQGVREIVHGFDRDLNVVTSQGLLRLFVIAEREYQRVLRAHSVVDFPELLDRSIRLLQGMDEFALSRYRLEARYHHVLVDEFQDTSCAQWQLVQLLVRTWTEGEGLSDQGPLKPTLFIVGDSKQSIYGFRDADVTVFKTASRWMERLGSGRPTHLSISRNLRSVPPLLSFVNDLFEAISKNTSRADAFVFGESDRFPDSSTALADDGALGLAMGADVDEVVDSVSTEIERLLASGYVRDIRSGERRSVQKSDIAILFRSRESHREFEAALEARGIPAYVYKGLGFFDADEIKDVMALVRYLADPVSDLRAAAFLRSRLVRLSDPGIHSLAPDIAASLWPAPDAAVGGDLDEEDRRVLGRAQKGVSRWIALADRVPPADLLDTVLNESAYAMELSGPRLAQARENLKKFRGLVRRLQNHGYATLARLAEHLDRLSVGDDSNAVIDATGAVSLMTVHAAKGLEFPIVFVVNLTRGTSGRRLRVPLAPASDAGAAGDDEPAATSVSVEDFQPESDESARARELEETKRLLYVAVTRARDRLYLSAVLKDGALYAGRGSLTEVVPEDVRRAMVPASGTDTVEWRSARGGRHVFRVCRPSGKAGVHADAASVDERLDDFGPLTGDQSVPRVAVTTPDTEESDRPARETQREDGSHSDAVPRLVGRLVHRLMQQSGDQTLDAREPTPDDVRQLMRPEELLSVPDSQRAIAETLQTLRALRHHPDVTRLLEEGEVFFEVPFSLRRPGSPATILRGTIDCLVQDARGRTSILEFKTGAARPEHAAQLATYVEAVQQLLGTEDVAGMLIYPDPR